MAGGRPKIEVPWEAIDRFASIHCTQEEISFCTQISIDTLDRACKRKFKMSFAAYCAQKKGYGKMSLRRAMWKKALDGDNTMCIWLSKQHLEMTDKFDSKVEQTQTNKVYIAEWGGKDENPDPGQGKAEE